jgi:hypothetical protein
MARQTIRVQRPNESLYDFVHNMRLAYDDMNESCLMTDGPIVMPEHFLNISMLVGMSHEGPYGHAKECIVTAFDPNFTLSAAEVTQQIRRQANHLDTLEAVTNCSAPPASAFLAGNQQNDDPPMVMPILIAVCDSEERHVIDWHMYCT